MTRFGTRLAAALRDRAPVCVGIDPHRGLLADWDLPDDAAGLERFARRAAEALAPHAAVIKPQSAFFERHGAAGIAVLERTIADCRAMGALVVLDVKRGDIGSTADAYADAYLDPGSPLFSDAVTVSPYLGFGSLQPFVDRAERAGSGLFVLARTSNPEGVQLQEARLPDGRSVAQDIVDQAAELNARVVSADEPLGDLGVVVGATVPPGALDLTRLAGAALAPGLGAQGGTTQDLARIFPPDVTVVASTSRDVLGAGPDIDRLRDRLLSVGDSLRAIVDR